MIFYKLRIDSLLIAYFMNGIYVINYNYLLITTNQLKILL